MQSKVRHRSVLARLGQGLLLFIALTVVAVMSGACYVKIAASRLAHVYSTNWNETGSCYIQSYIPQYSALGFVGRLGKLFSSEAFFRVYAKDGTLLKSSEWLLWQNEFTTSERSHWFMGHVVYPTVTGYEGWTIPACG